MPGTSQPQTLGASVSQRVDHGAPSQIPTTTRYNQHGTLTL